MNTAKLHPFYEGQPKTFEPEVLQMMEELRANDVRHATALLAISYEMIESILESKNWSDDRSQLRLRRALDSIQYARRHME